MISYDYKTVLKPQAGYIAKSSGETLVTHSFFVYSILKKLLDDFEFPVPPTGNFEHSELREILLLAALVHDIGKMRKSAQENLKSGRGAGEHQATKEELRRYLEEASVKVSDNVFEFIYELVLHHYKSWEDLKKQEVPGIGFFAQYIKIADWIASMHKMNFSWLAILKDRFEKFSEYKLTGVMVSRFESPALHKMFEEIASVFAEHNWKVVRFMDDGILFAGKGDVPDKEQIITRVYNAFIEALLENITPEFGAQSILDILKKAFLLEWLNVQKDKLIDGFREKKERYYFFLKFIRELIELTKEDSSYGFLKNVIRMRAHKMIEKNYGVTFEDSIEAINSIIETRKIKISECIPPAILNAVFSEELIDRELKSLRSQEMFEILYKLGEYIIQNSNKLKDIVAIKDIFREYLTSIIAMEESLDFSKIAKDILTAYKNYKKKRGFSSPSNVYLATCEFCGAPTIIPTQDALGLPESKLFSTSKGKADSHMAICPLCIFDIQFFNKKLNINKRELKGSLPIFIKIKKDVYDVDPTRFEDLIAELNVRRGKLKKLPELAERYLIPIDEKAKKKPRYSVISDEILFYVEGIAPNEVKNTLNKYYIHYWVISNMGVRVSIGEYTSNNYFDKTIFPDNDLYKHAMLIQLVSKAFQSVKKTEVQAFLRAGNMIEHNPAALFSLLSSYGDKSGKGAQKDIVEIIKILKEVPKYMGLLEDAKFWATCLKNYFIEWGGNKKFSKHFVTKALARGLSMIIQSNDVEFAFAEFLKYIREDISQDKRQELEETLKESKRKFEEYWKLRNEDIGKFINFRNALVTATYLMVRYDELRSVV